MQFDGIRCNSFQNLIQCKSMQFDAIAIRYSSVQYVLIRCNCMQVDAVQCHSMQFDVIQCSTMQFDVIRRSSMQFDSMWCSPFYVIRCNSMEFDAIRSSLMQFNGIKCNSISIWIQFLPSEFMSFFMSIAHLLPMTSKLCYGERLTC